MDRDTASLFDEKYCVSKPNGKFHVDLWSVNRDNLVSEGLEPINIYISDECTICNSDKYYSYRVHKEKKPDGRWRLLLCLNF